MYRGIATALALAAALAGAAPARGETAPERLLAPPPQAGPVLVNARFDLHDINEINDGPRPSNSAAR